MLLMLGRPIRPATIHAQAGTPTSGRDGPWPSSTPDHPITDGAHATPTPPADPHQGGQPRMADTADLGALAFRQVTGSRL